MSDVETPLIRRTTSSNKNFLCNDTTDTTSRSIDLRTCQQDETNEETHLALQNSQNNSNLFHEDQETYTASSNSIGGDIQGDEHNGHIPQKIDNPNTILWNFIFMSVLFSANHGGVTSCLSLSTARLGPNLGAWQSSVLYLSYTASALFGATYVTKVLGARDTLIVGMSIYCFYTGCFVIYALCNIPSIAATAAIVGALLGGVGGGCIWTAQGSYFTTASEEYAESKQMSMEKASSKLGGVFAAIYLGEEVFMRLFSSLVIKFWGWSWIFIFIAYTSIAVGSTVLMFFVKRYPTTDKEHNGTSSSSSMDKATATWRLIVSNYKVKYMIPLCAVFGLSAAVMTSYVNGQVVRVALDDTNSVYVGFLSSITSIVAAVMSILFACVAQRMGNGLILFIGCSAFFLISFTLFIQWDLERWTLLSLSFLYVLQGIGRSTFEGALRAEFAEKFVDEKEGAFGSIVFFNGLVSTIGFVLTTNLKCSNESRYCVEFSDGKLHDTATLELLTMFTAVAAVLSYWRVKVLHSRDTIQTDDQLLSNLLTDEHEME